MKTEISFLQFMTIVFLFFGIGLGVGMFVSLPIKQQQHRQVCNTTKQEPIMVAAVDPKTGELFAVPTLQVVCTDVNK